MSFCTYPIQSFDRYESFLPRDHGDGYGHDPLEEQRKRIAQHMHIVERYHILSWSLYGRLYHIYSSILRIYTLCLIGITIDDTNRTRIANLTTHRFTWRYRF